jgi:hypothetical protein
MLDSCRLVNTIAHGLLPVVGGGVKDARRSQGPTASSSPDAPASCRRHARQEVRILTTDVFA